MAGILTALLGVVLVFAGWSLGIDLLAQAGAAAIPLGLWMVVKSR